MRNEITFGVYFNIHNKRASLHVCILFGTK